MIFRSADSTSYHCPSMDQHCCGSHCACWRWSEGAPARKSQACIDAFRTDEPERPECVPKSWEWIPGDKVYDSGARWLEPMDEWKKRFRSRRGYCGLGGKPEFGYADEN